MIISCLVPAEHTGLGIRLENGSVHATLCSPADCAWLYLICPHCQILMQMVQFSREWKSLKRVIRTSGDKLRGPLRQVRQAITKTAYYTFDLNWQPSPWKIRISWSSQWDYGRACKKENSCLSIVWAIRNLGYICGNSFLKKTLHNRMLVLVSKYSSNFSILEFQNFSFLQPPNTALSNLPVPHNREFWWEGECMTHNGST